MKYPLQVVLFIFIATEVFGNDISVVRDTFLKSKNDESQADTLFAMLLNADTVNNKALLAYKGAARIIMAGSAFLPIRKHRYFIEGKNYLESAVQSDSSNIEVLFIRFTIQDNLPSFLNYDHRDTDYMTIINNLPYYPLPDYFKRVIYHVLDSSAYATAKITRRETRKRK